MNFNFRTISVFLVLALLTRSVVPVGYMLSSVEKTSGFSLQLDLCPTQNNFALSEVSAEINATSHLSHQQMVSHDHASHHPILEMPVGKPHQGHSDNLTSHDTCHLWAVSSASIVSIEIAQWLLDPLSLKAVSDYTDITPNRNVYTRKQTRATPLTNLS